MRDVIIRHSSLDIPRLPLTKCPESVRKTAHEGADSVRLLVRLAGSLLAPGAGRPGAVAPGLADRPPLSDRGGGSARSVGAGARLAFSPCAIARLSPELSYFGRSRTTSCAFLSSRKPAKTGCRKWPSRVHSAKRTWHTSSGFSHLHRFISAPVKPPNRLRFSGRLPNGHSGRLNFWKVWKSVCNDFWSKPVPTLPANRSRFFS